MLDSSRKRWASLCVAAFMASCATTAERRVYDDFDRIDASLLSSTPGQGLGKDHKPRQAKRADLKTIDALELFALQRNAAVRAAYLDWKAAITLLPSARRWPAVMVRYAGLPLPLETKAGPQRHRLGVSQAIPWPGKFGAKADVLAAKATVAQRRFEGRRLIALTAVRQPVAVLAALNAKVAVVEDQVRLYSYLATAVHARLAVSRATMAQASRVTLRVAQLEDQVARLKAMAPGARARIRQAAGLTVDSVLPAIPPLGQTRLPKPALADLLKRLATHPRAQLQTAMAATYRAAAHRTDAMRLPDFVVGVEWMEIGDPGTGALGAGDDAMMASLGLRIPLSIGADDAEAKSAQQRALAAEARREGEIARAEAAVHGLVARLTDARRREGLYTTTLVPQAQAAWETALAGYSSGRGSFNDLIEIAKLLLTYRGQVVDARAESALAMVALVALVGDFTPVGGTAPTPRKPGTSTP